MKECPKCQKLHDKPGTHCSRSCANKRPQTEETRRKQSEWSKANPRGWNQKSKKERITHAKVVAANRKKPRKITTCRQCNNTFEHPAHLPRYFCSNECQGQGVRIGAGYARKGLYRGFWCDSSYELAVVIYCLDHNIPIKRNKKSYIYFWEGRRRRYTPDFRIAGTLVEIKGYYTPITDVKIASVNEPVLLMCRADLHNVFQYITWKYNVKTPTDLDFLYEQS
jgi:hypothetical protein